MCGKVSPCLRHKLVATLDSAGAKPRVFLAYKRRGELVTRPDTDDRPSVFSRLGFGRHIAAIGRLDYQSEGLLVLTTCGMLARCLEHPDIGALVRIYNVTTKGIVTPNKLTAMRRGVRIDGLKYRPLEVRVLETGPDRTVFQFKCTEGKNRMIRRICDHLRLRVTKLVRTNFGPFSLENMKRHFAATEVRVPSSLLDLVQRQSPPMLRSHAATSDNKAQGCPSFEGGQIAEGESPS